MEDIYSAYKIPMSGQEEIIRRMLLQPYAKPQEGGARNRAELLYVKIRKSQNHRGVVVSPELLRCLLRCAIGKENMTKVDMWHSGIEYPFKEE